MLKNQLIIHSRIQEPLC